MMGTLLYLRAQMKKTQESYLVWLILNKTGLTGLQRNVKKKHDRKLEACISYGLKTINT